MSANVVIHESRRVVRARNIVLDHALRLPMAARLRVGMRTVCDACRQPITDDYFYGGFAAGHRNMLLHEHCTPEAMRTHALTGEPKSPDAVDPVGERVTE
jgi:hypothetical protein